MGERLDRQHRGHPTPCVRWPGAGVHRAHHRIAADLAQPLPPGGGEPDVGLVAVQPGPELHHVRPPPGRQVEVGGAVELLRQWGQREDLVDPVGRRSAPAGLVGHHIPTAALEHQAVRLQHAGHLTVPAPVAHLDAVLPPDRLGRAGQLGGGVAVGVPPGSVQVEALLQSGRPVAQRRGERGVQLELQRGHHVAVAQLVGRAGQPGQEQPVGLLGGQPGQSGPPPVDELVAAGVPGLAVERDAGGVQRLDVPVDGAGRDGQPLGELRGGQPPMRLEQQQDGEKSRSPHFTDTSCQGTRPTVPAWHFATRNYERPARCW